MIMKKSIFRLANVVLFSTMITSTTLIAEEGGSGHYMPGSMSSFIDGVPAEPTFITRLNYLNYKASSSITFPKGSGGLLAQPLQHFLYFILISREI